MDEGVGKGSKGTRQYEDFVRNTEITHKASSMSLNVEAACSKYA